MVAAPRATLGAGRLRVLNQPKPIAVRNGGKELAGASDVFWRGRWQRVVETLERWRVDEEWWRERPVSRMYSVMLLESGARLELFQDLIDGQWYVQ